MTAKAAVQNAATPSTQTQAVAFTPQLCSTCANYGTPCLRLDQFVTRWGNIEIGDACGIFAPIGTPPEQNPGLTPQFLPPEVTPLQDTREAARDVAAAPPAAPEPAKTVGAALTEESSNG